MTGEIFLPRLAMAPVEDDDTVIIAVVENINRITHQLPAAAETRLNITVPQTEDRRQTVIVPSLLLNDESDEDVIERTLGFRDSLPDRHRQESPQPAPAPIVALPHARVRRSLRSIVDDCLTDLVARERFIVVYNEPPYFADSEGVAWGTVRNSWFSKNHLPPPAEFNRLRDELIADGYLAIRRQRVVKPRQDIN